MYQTSIVLKSSRKTVSSVLRRDLIQIQYTTFLNYDTNLQSCTKKKNRLFTLTKVGKNK